MERSISSARGKLAAKAVKLLRALAARTYYLLKESQPVTKRQPEVSSNEYSSSDASGSPRTIRGPRSLPLMIG